MKQKFKKWTKFTLRWGIAVVGIWVVLAKTSFHDRVQVLDDKDRPMAVRIVDGAMESASAFPRPDGPPIPRGQVWTAPDRSAVEIPGPNGKSQKVKLLAVHPAADQQANQPPLQLLIQNSTTGKPQKINPSEADYTVRVLHPLIEVGLLRLCREANTFFLLISLILLPISYLITSRRWHMLLETVDIHIGQGRAFILNMVGSFYNSFMPGSTGGDLVKAYYASRHTDHRTRAVMSVIIDRVLGLVALIILGGVMAATQWHIPTCRYVAISSGLIMLGMSIGLFVFYHRDLRRKTGLEWLIKRLPMQHQVHRAIETMEIYGQRPWVSLAAVLMTFPVHITTIISATFAGKAFGLPLHSLYYWAIVPVITLVGAIPISPQGAGVMEYFAVELTRRQGVAVSQAFALVMAIRFCQIFWNLAAAFFVLRGGYHAPTTKQAQELEQDEQQEEKDAALGGQSPVAHRDTRRAPSHSTVIRSSPMNTAPILNPEP